MNKLVILLALYGTVAFAVPDLSDETNDDDNKGDLFWRSGAVIENSDENSDDTYFRSAGGALVKMDSIESQGLKGFKYSYPVTKYTVKEESDEEDNIVAPIVRTFSPSSPSIVAPSIQAYSASPVVFTTENSHEEDDDDSSSIIRLAYPATPSIKAVGFKPLFTGYKPTTTAVVTSQDVSVGTPIAKEYSVDTTKAVDTTAKAGVVSNAFVNPILYTVPATTFNRISVPATTVSHISAPTTRFVAGSNQFYTAGNSFNYPTTFYSPRPFFYTHRVAPFTTVSNVVNTLPHTYDSFELDD